jgi:hypothetical protein
MTRHRPRGLSLRPPFAGRASTLVVAALAATVAASPADATWRCGSRLVAIGDPAGRVLSRCGEPSYLTASTEVVTVPLASGVEVTRIVPVETWTYDRGPHEFVRYLTFRDGSLEEIVEGGYGVE